MTATSSLASPCRSGYMTPWQDPNSGKQADCTRVMIKPYKILLHLNPIPFKFLKSPVWWECGGHVDMKWNQGNVRPDAQNCNKCKEWLLMRGHTRSRNGSPGTESSGKDHKHIQKPKDPKWLSLSSIVSWTRTCNHPHGTQFVSVRPTEVPEFYDVCKQRGKRELVHLSSPTLSFF